MMRRLSILFFICAIVLAAVGAFFVRDVLFLAPKQNATPIEVVIAQGSGVSTIAKQLKESNLIEHPTFFKWFVMWSRTENKLQAGTFSFLPNTSIATIVLVLSNPTVSEIRVTIPEGYTNKQIGQKLSEVFLNFDLKEWKSETEGLEMFQGLEGYLFPDTYQFAKDASVRDIVTKMRANLDRRLIENQIPVEGDDISVNIYPSNFSFFQVLTMASIIEKEVQTPEDMKRVAGVLFNRLSIGMPLQVDSTLTYINQKTSATLTLSDLKMDSLYNTYTNRGLPPGPICNPGMNAILAVLHPTDSDYLYFLTTKDGKAVYAKTHAEHVANKQKYLR
jgi:UPF0755 protein